MNVACSHNPINERANAGYKCFRAVVSKPFSGTNGAYRLLVSFLASLLISAKACASPSRLCTWIFQKTWAGQDKVWGRSGIKIKGSLAEWNAHLEEGWQRLKLKGLL